MAGKSLRVQAVGIFIEQMFSRGEVVSMHRDAVNIFGNADLLFSLVADLSSMTALSIYLPALFQDGFPGNRQRQKKIRAGLEVERQENNLYLADMVIALDFRNTWDGRLTLTDVAGFAEQNIDYLLEALLESEIEDGLIALHKSWLDADFFVRKARKILAELTITGKSPQIRGLSRLVGLGIGLTPSGDDFITGVLLGERIRELLGSSDKQNLPFQAVDKAEINDVISKTNYPGRSLLWMALKGSFPYYLIEAARCLAGATGPDAIELAVKSAALHGATSGIDALSGLLWYLRQAY